jgi:multicomponent Na+:H+ antiporter subunit D
MLYGTLFMMAGAYTLSRGGHVRADFAYRMAPPRAQAGLDLTLYILFFLPAMNLAGIPPLSGFLGKVTLIDAALDAPSPLAIAAVVAGVLTSLLTLIAVIRVWQRAFWQDRGEDDERVHSLRVLPRVWVVAASALVGITVALTALAGPLTSFADRAAQDIQRGAYQQAVEEAMP